MPSKQLIDSTVIAQIQTIITSGNKAEIELGRDGVKVIEVIRKVVLPNKDKTRQVI